VESRTRFVCVVTTLEQTKLGQRTESAGSNYDDWQREWHHRMLTFEVSYEVLCDTWIVKVVWGILWYLSFKYSVMTCSWCRKTSLFFDKIWRTHFAADVFSPAEKNSIALSIQVMRVFSYLWHYVGLQLLMNSHKWKELSDATYPQPRRSRSGRSDGKNGFIQPTVAVYTRSLYAAVASTCTCKTVKALQIVLLCILA